MRRSGDAPSPLIHYDWISSITPPPIYLGVGDPKALKDPRFICRVPIIVDEPASKREARLVANKWPVSTAEAVREGSV